MSVDFLAVSQLDQYIAPMQEKLKQQVLDAFLLVMRPVVRILLRYGIGFREFVEVTKTAYVDVASSDFGLRGRPTNISRVAVMTGLTRKEVKRIRDRIASGELQVKVKTTPLTDVLHNWYAQSEFTDDAGRPISLPFSGEGVTFSSLVKKHGGDIPPGAMRTELKRVNAITEDEDGNLTVNTRQVRPESGHDKLVMALVHSVYPLISTVAHNTEAGNDGKTWANRLVHTTSLASTNRGQLRRIAWDRITEFAESVDDIFISYEAMHKSDESDDSKPVAVGVFYFEETDEYADYEW